MDTGIIDAALRSTLGRVVALLTPLLATAFGLLAFQIQKWLGIDLQQYTAVAASFVASVILGGMLLGLKWLEGRARFESAALAIAHASEVGKAAAAAQPVAGVPTANPIDSLPDHAPAPGVQPSDLGEDPDDGDKDFIGPDPTAPTGTHPSQEPIE